jgi:hypothetical protein
MTYTSSARRIVVTEGLREDELKAEIADLYDRLHRAQAELREIELAAMPFHAGDIVEFKRSELGWEAAIVRAVTRWGTFMVSLRKKDGTWAKAERHAIVSEMRPLAVVGNTGNVLQ